MRKPLIPLVVGVLMCVAATAQAGIIFDVTGIGPASHPYQQQMTFELSGSLDGPLPAFHRDKLYIVSTTPNDTDWVLSSGLSTTAGPVFGPAAPPNTVNNFVHNGSSLPADYLELDYFGPLAVGQSTQSTGPYTTRFTFTTIVPGNVNGLALYWGRSSFSGAVDSGTFLASDSNLNGPNPVPEPSSLILSFVATCAVIGYRRSRQNRALT